MLLDFVNSRGREGGGRRCKLDEVNWERERDDRIKLYRIFGIGTSWLELEAD